MVFNLIHKLNVCFFIFIIYHLFMKIVWFELFLPPDVFFFLHKKVNLFIDSIWRHGEITCVPR